MSRNEMQVYVYSPYGCVELVQAGCAGNRFGMHTGSGLEIGGGPGAIDHQKFRRAP